MNSTSYIVLVVLFIISIIIGCKIQKKKMNGSGEDDRRC